MKVNQLISSGRSRASPSTWASDDADLKHFTLTSDGAKITSQAVLELPDESMRGMLERRPTRCWKPPGSNKAIANLSLTAVGQAAAILAEKQSLFTASNETDATVLLTATDPEINYCGLQIKTARVRLDKANHVIAELRFDFVDQSALWLRLGHRGAIDGAGDVNCPTRISLRHNMKINAGGVKLPDPITIAYQNYTFR